MKKKLETRFPAARIKKIMQADEDVGKIAMAVPVLVSKALEMFLQDLCDKTYGITIQKGMKTVSSFHLKQCIHSYINFDFLKDVVSKVPDIRSSDAGGEDRSVKRKAVDDGTGSEEDKQCTTEMGAGRSSGSSSNPTGQGRPRGRPKGSGRPKGNKDSSCSAKYVDDPGPSLTPVYENQNSSGQSKSAEEASGSEEQKKEIAFGQDFDLNLDYEENLKVLGMETDSDDIKKQEHFDLSISGMAINKPPLLNVTRSFEEEEDEDDYDNEED